MTILQGFIMLLKLECLIIVLYLVYNIIAFLLGYTKLGRQVAEWLFSKIK